MGSAADFVQFIGRFHPLVVHFPIGFLFFAFILELFGRWKKNSELAPAISLALLLGAVSAFVACVLGYMLSQSGEYDADALDPHFWLGVVTTIVSFLVWLIKLGKIGLPRFSEAKLSIFVSALVVVLVGVTGHYGGNLTHGSDYLVKYAPFINKNQKTVQPVTKVGDATVFDHLVNPILQDKCASCHNSGKKKGGLSFHNTEAILKGGKNGKVFVAGDITKSEMIHRIELDPHHEDAMPPEGKTPLTDDEKTLLSYWVENAHADFAVTVDSVQTPDEILGIAASFLGLGSTTAGGTLLAADEVDKTVINEVIAEGFLVRELVYESNLFDVILPAKTITEVNKEELDSKLEKLLALKGNILWLSLGDNLVTDSHLKMIGQMDQLQRLKLEKNPITDAGIAEIIDHLNISSLNLYQTNITKASLESFSKMKTIKNIYAWGTAITKEDITPYASQEHFPEIILGM